MDARQTRPWSRRTIALVALTGVICLSLVAVAAAWASRTVSRDDCVTVTTDLGEGRSRSVETCS